MSERHRAGSRVAPSLLLAVVMACQAKPGPRHDIPTVPQPPAGAAVPVPTAAIGRDHAGRACYVLDSKAHIALTGRLAEEEHLGPPGYGETPSRDLRDTIPVLVLARPLHTCPLDVPYAEGDSTGLWVDRIELRHVSWSARSQLGRRVTVYGTLASQTWGSDYLPVELYVDSVPDLRAVPRHAAS